MNSIGCFLRCILCIKKYKTKYKTNILKHGIFCFLKHGKLEDALFECFRDALRSQITQGAADVVIDDDKRKNARHNVLSSILSTVNMSFLASQCTQRLVSYVASESTSSSEFDEVRHITRSSLALLAGLDKEIRSSPV